MTAIRYDTLPGYAALQDAAERVYVTAAALEREIKAAEIAGLVVGLNVWETIGAINPIRVHLGVSVAFPETIIGPSARKSQGTGCFA